MYYDFRFSKSPFELNATRLNANSLLHTLGLRSHLHSSITYGRNRIRFRTASFVSIHPSLGSIVTQTNALLRPPWLTKPS